MPYRENDVPGPTWADLFLADGDGPLRWSSRYRPLPDGVRMLFGAVLGLLFLMTASAVPVFCLCAGGARWLLSLVDGPVAVLFLPMALIAWYASPLAYFLPRERLEGVRLMRRSVAIDERVEIDGESIGSSSDVRACRLVFVNLPDSAAKGSARNAARWSSVSLLYGKTIYELCRTQDGAAALDAVEKLRVALGGEHGEWIDQEVGNEPFREATRGGAILSAVFYGALMMRGFSGELPPLWLAWTIAGLAVVARISLDVARLAQCNGVDATRFRARFAGAEAVKPIAWLTLPRARRFRLVAHLVLLGAVVGGLVAHGVKVPGMQSARAVHLHARAIPPHLFPRSLKFRAFSPHKAG